MVTEDSPIMPITKLVKGFLYMYDGGQWGVLTTYQRLRLQLTSTKIGMFVIQAPSLLISVTKRVHWEYDSTCQITFKRFSLKVRPVSTPTPIFQKGSELKEVA